MLQRRVLVLTADRLGGRVPVGSDEKDGLPVARGERNQAGEGFGPRVREVMEHACWYADGGPRANVDKLAADPMPALTAENIQQFFAIRVVVQRVLLARLDGREAERLQGTRRKPIVAQPDEGAAI